MAGSHKRLRMHLYCPLYLLKPTNHRHETESQSVTEQSGNSEQPKPDIDHTGNQSDRLAGSSQAECVGHQGDITASIVDHTGQTAGIYFALLSVCCLFMFVLVLLSHLLGPMPFAS